MCYHSKKLWLHNEQHDAGWACWWYIRREYMECMEIERKWKRKVLRENNKDLTSRIRNGKKPILKSKVVFCSLHSTGWVFFTALRIMKFYICQLIGWFSTDWFKWFKLIRNMEITGFFSHNFLSVINFIIFW